MKSPSTKRGVRDESHDIMKKAYFTVSFEPHAESPRAREAAQYVTRRGMRRHDLVARGAAIMSVARSKRSINGDNFPAKKQSNSTIKGLQEKMKNVG